MREKILNSLVWYELKDCPQAYNCVYVWKNKINDKIYVGMAKDLHKRNNKHIIEYVSERQWDKPFYKSLRKYGIENYNIAIIIENVESTEDLSELEKYYIKKTEALINNFTGYNVHEGGKGGWTTKGYDQEKKEQHCKKLSESAIGKTHSDNTKEKIKNWWSNLSDEEKDYRINKLHGANKGHNIFSRCTDDEKEQICKKIGESVKTAWENKSDAEKKEIFKKHSDYMKKLWSIMSDEEKTKIIKRGEDHPRSKKVFCPELNEYFESCGIASKKYNICASSIIRCANGKYKSAGKHPETGEKLTWRYVD